MATQNIAELIRAKGNKQINFPDINNKLYIGQRKKEGPYTECEHLMLRSACVSAEFFVCPLRLFKYMENFISKNWKLSEEKKMIVFIYLLKT